MTGHIRMTDDEIRLLWRNRGLPDLQMVRCIAELNGCDVDMVLMKLDSLGIAKADDFRNCRQGTSFSEEEVSRLIAMTKKGLSIAAIAERLNRSKNSVHSKMHLLRKAGRLT